VKNIREVLKDSKIVIVSGYCAYPYERYLRYLNVETLVDSKLRGTAGHLKNVYLKYRFKNIILINGDLYISKRCIENIMKKVETCIDSGNVLTIFTIRRKFKYGIIISDGELRWVEKPEFSTISGIYYINLEAIYPILEHLETMYDMVDMNILFRELVSRKVNVSYIDLECLEDDVIDIGTHLDYIKTVSLLNEDSIYHPMSR